MYARIFSKECTYVASSGANRDFFPWIPDFWPIPIWESVGIGLIFGKVIGTEVNRKLKL